MSIWRKFGRGRPAEDPVAPIARPAAVARPARHLPDPPAGYRSAPIPRALFDEGRYLGVNPDVAAALARGEFRSAYEHYIRHGHDDEMAGLRTSSLPLVSAPLGGSRHPETAVRDRLVDLEIEKRALLSLWEEHRPTGANVRFDMLSEDIDDALVPPLDRADCDESTLDEDQRAWRRDGYVIKRGFLPDDLIDRYCAVRERHPWRTGWQCPTPYMQVHEMRDLSTWSPMMKLLKRLVGEEMGLHLNLTGWVTTDRNWHQDDYLNPPYVNGWYAAVWMALDDIHPDSGPFEFIPGSHRWPLLRRDRVKLFLPAHERDHEHWPSMAERFVNDAAAAEIARRGVAPDRFIARKGDLLVWHGRLMHRGSHARVPDMPRRALIAHYTGLSHRIDMPDVARTPDGDAYFVHSHPLDWDPYAREEAAA